MTCVRKAPTGVVWVIGALTLLLPLAALLDDDEPARCEVAAPELLFDATLDTCPPPLELNDRFLPRDFAGSEYSSRTDDCWVSAEAF